MTTQSQEDPLTPGKSTSTKVILRWVVAAVIAGLVAYPLLRQSHNDAPAASASSASGPEDAADAEINLSLHAYQEGKFQEAITAAQAALKLRPDFALAYNNLAGKLPPAAPL